MSLRLSYSVQAFVLKRDTMILSFPLLHVEKNGIF